jgi:DNA modification methylase
MSREPTQADRHTPESGPSRGHPRSRRQPRGGQALKATQVPLERLLEADWNANKVPPATLAKIRRSLVEFGLVENLVARPHPERKGFSEVLSGNHRLPLLHELGYRSAPVVVVELDDPQARLLAQTLNRTRGTDDPEAYARLLEQVLTEFSAAEVAGFLPETEATIAQVLRELAGEPLEQPLQPPAEPRSKPGELYELGPHRLFCGDATNPEQVAYLMGGEQAVLMPTDPPYGVGLDHGWRDGLRQARGSARAGQLANDDRADWSEALLLTKASVCYLWHSALHSREAMDGLEAAGFELRQQIVWVKTIHVLGRAHYQWAHECAWYAVRKGCTARWRGGRKQTTVWEAASPIMAFGASGEEEATPHPTQKPLELFERPIFNHTEPGELVFDPFLGSGTCLIAAEKTGRRCFGLELDPRFCDVIRDRYAAYLASGGGR